MKQSERWFSERLGQEVQLVRWGHFGAPVLVFPTAGGDAEEIERFHLLGALRELIDGGRIKVYSCDSVAGRVWVAREGSPDHRAHVQSQFHEFVHREVVPAIRMDCRSGDILTIAAGASIGAFNALAVTCRYPGDFRAAVCLSGTYDLSTVFDVRVTPDLYFSSPLHFLPDLDGAPLDLLRRRFVLLACGKGRWEDLGQSQRMAGLLGRRGIPNRLDPWGEEWHHDWVTWRQMLPRYLDELT